MNAPSHAVERPGDNAYHRLDSHEEALEAGDTSGIGDWRRAGWRFHQELISACGSSVLIQTHAEVFDKYLRYQMIALTFRPAASRAEHLALCHAGLARDTHAAGSSRRCRKAGSPSPTCAERLSGHIRAAILPAL